jgi:uncharacterized protein (TIGR03032 family)
VERIMSAKDRLHERLGRALRDPLDVVSLTDGLGKIDPRLLEHDADASFWKALRRLKVRLLVSREYEHLVLSLSASGMSWFPLPHPSGIAVDPKSGGFHVACTRNPNMLVEFRPREALLPVRTRFLPGRLYLHDLAWIGGRLHGNAVGENAVVELGYDRDPKRVWWPSCIKDFDRNVLQLNSIAAGRTVAGSFFSASCAKPGGPPPGDPAFEVDGRGVIFSGRTRRPVAEGLTRPHSLRLHRGRLWVDNSGYGEVGVVEKGGFVRVARLPGWTRGLSIVDDVLFVGTSAVLPRFRNYAPGLDLRNCVCGVHAVEMSTGRVLGSIRWPWGNQIFAVEATRDGAGFPLRDGADPESVKRLFYS